nr:UDP-glycosyltransferase 76C3-like [Malus domestica]
MEQSKGRRVILFPLPYQGHINPMLQLANILHSKGFFIAILHTNFNSLNPSTLNTNFTYHSIPVDLTENEASIKDPTLRLSILNAKCVEPFRGYLAGSLSDDVNSEDPIACLISDPIFDFTRSVAESFKLPRIVLRTGGAASSLFMLHFHFSRKRVTYQYQSSTSTCSHKAFCCFVVRHEKE